MARKISSRELGLILGARLMKAEDLHYGYWDGELEVTLANLRTAQARYSEFLLERIPHGVRSVLDVGCGMGHLSQILARRGYQVEAISPSVELTRLARERLGESVPVHLCTLEAFCTGRRFDLVLFSESFQYMPAPAALAKALGLLNAGGYVLISDFFRLRREEKSPLGGGHDLEAFYALLGTLPLRTIRDEDITRQTAPNLDLVCVLLEDTAVPVWEALGCYLRANHPWLSGAGEWVFRQRLQRVREKYLSRQRNGAAFAHHKSYRCMLLQRCD